ncbi:MAG TPA: DNA recombination protein RmuC [Steroidobacteraceae bacterium]|jgi:DNA recombination protein RmuC|nr:DNA recombination protein RmuC [Steroidobacteraceae bacterium]
MTMNGLWIWLLFAGVLGFVLGWLLMALRASRSQQQIGLDLENARARLKAQETLDQERNSMLERAQERLSVAFDGLARETLRSNSELFLKLAHENLGQQQLQATHALREREQAIETMLKPIQEALGRTQAQIATIEKDRHEAFGAMRQYLESVNQSQSALQRETRNLVNALRRPEVRGQWGEMSLRRLVELAGMTPHCDFTEQVHTASEEGALRPDLIIHMPDGRDLVVDVKTPLGAYLEAVDATSDEARAGALRRHGQLIAERVRALAAKSYWAQFTKSPDFVILFVPGDQFLAAALNENPGLLDDAIRQSVILATPTSFIAMLKAIAYGWRQLALAQNAETIRDLGEDLYRRLSVFGAHLGRVGKSLDSSVEAYNSAIGSLERQVLPAARRFTDLGLKPDRTLETLDPVEKLARTPSSDAPDVAPDAGSSDERH